MTNSRTLNSLLFASFFSDFILPVCLKLGAMTYFLAKKSFNVLQLFSVDVSFLNILIHFFLHSKTTTLIPTIFVEVTIPTPSQPLMTHSHSYWLVHDGILTQSPIYSSHNQELQVVTAHLSLASFNRRTHRSVRPPWWRCWCIMAFYRCQEQLGLGHQGFYRRRGGIFVQHINVQKFRLLMFQKSGEPVDMVNI